MCEGISTNDKECAKILAAMNLTINVANSIQRKVTDPKEAGATLGEVYLAVYKAIDEATTVKVAPIRSHKIQ